MSKRINQILLMLVILMTIVVGVLWWVPKETRKENVLENTKLVLYEGPKTLREATVEDQKATAENLRDFLLLKATDTELTVNGQTCFVYDTNVNHTRSWASSYLPPISRTPMAYFDFEGVAQLVITVHDRPLENVTISPVSYGITPVIDKDAHTVTFTITTPDAYTLVFNDSPERAFHIFANPLETDVPDFNDEKVIVIGPGEWDIENIVLEDGQTLYVSGGAVVHGIVNANFAKNITVMGRGIIDGSHLEGWKGKTAYVPLKFDNCENVIIKDLIILNANAWVCQAYESTNGLIDGLKIISPRPNGDGITLQSCENYTVKNCFVRTWDDSLVVKNYGRSSKDITFSDCQLWTDLAQSMEIGYETNKGKIDQPMITRIAFENITVLANYHKPVISVHNGDDAAITDIRFSNITVENAQMGSGDGAEMPYLIDINIDQSANWSTTKERGTVKGVLIENVSVLSGRVSSSRIRGFDEAHRVEDVLIRNLMIFGKLIDNAELGQFEIDAKTTKSIHFE